MEILVHKKAKKQTGTTAGDTLATKEKLGAVGGDNGKGKGKG